MKVRIKTILQSYEPWWYENHKGKMFNVEPAEYNRKVYVVKTGYYAGNHICKNHAIVEQSIDIPERLFKI